MLRLRDGIHGNGLLESDIGAVSMGGGGISGAGRSFQAAVRRRQQAGFVARTTELAQFRANLALPADGSDRQFIFCVHGDGGVGKSFLLSRWRGIAQGVGALTC
jgi:hypothetical protein